MQKNEAIERIRDTRLPLTRNIVNQIVFNFLHMKF